MCGELENLVHRISYTNIQPYGEYSESTISMTLTPASYTTTSNAIVQVQNFHSRLLHP